MESDPRQLTLRMAAFGHVRRLLEIHDQLMAADLSAGFILEGKRVPLVNPQRGICSRRCRGGCLCRCRSLPLQMSQAA